MASSSPVPGFRHTGSVHPTGITALYVPSSPVVDICFVHGFTGHPEKTWASNVSKKRAANDEPPAPVATKRAKLDKIILPFRQRDSISESSSTTPSVPVYWPRDLLPDVVPRARVLTFGYDTNIRHIWNGSISENRLGDHATDFLAALEDSRRHDTRRPLIFVAHSLGGLLVKDTLRLSKSYEQSQPERCNVYRSTTSLFFFGTPHVGADPRNTLHRVLGDLARTLGFQVNNDIVRTLMPGVERSQLLAEGFLRWTNECNWSIYTFQEEFAHRMLRVKIVDDSSSSIHDPQHERKVHIRADHVDMCRFTSPDDPEFCKVSSALLRAHEQLPGPCLTPNPDDDISPRRHESPQSGDTMLSREHLDAILENLSFDGIDARYMTLKTAERKTCQWLPRHHLYKSWIDSSKMSMHHGFLWIKGKPGTGKSISMKYLYGHSLRSKRDRIVLKFFFNARGNSLEHSTEGMYRSLLWQLIEALRGTGVPPNMLGQLLDINKTAPIPIETLKETFDSMLAQVGCRELYCFVDALDECSEDEIRDMVYFFEGLNDESISPASSCLRVCFSSRHYPHITIRHGLQLVLEDEVDHSNDIRNYIHSRLRLDPSEQRQSIEEEIFDGSSSIFLWAALVVDILNKEHDKGGDVSVRKRLRQIPRGLHDLFQDMLTRDNEDMENMTLCIQWILFAKRPLRPEELYFAIQLGSDADAPMVWDQTSISLNRINRFNLNASKGLAELTKKDTTVQFIHESVRDYLLREKGLETLLRFRDSRISLSEGISHEVLRDICLNQVRGGHRIRETTGNSIDGKDMPFLRYAVTNILSHADSAQTLGCDQSSFLASFPLNTWVELDNALQPHKSRHHSLQVDLLYLLAEQDLDSLIRIHPHSFNPLDTNRGQERFINPLAAAIACGSNKAFFTLALHAAEWVLAPDQPQDLHKVKTELRNTPPFKSTIGGAYWKRMSTLSLFCLLGSKTLLHAVWDRISGHTPRGLDDILRGAPCSLDTYLYVISRGCSVSSTDKSGAVALKQAVKADALETARFLLKAGANPNLRSCDALNCVKSASMASLLICCGANTHIDFTSAGVEFVDHLVSALSALPNDNLLNYLRSDPPEFNILSPKSSNLITILQDGGPRFQPLIRAAFNADPMLFTRKDRRGTYPLIAAVRGNDVEVIRMLTQVDQTDTNYHINTVRDTSITENFIDVNVRDMKGHTALGVAIEEGHITTVRLLLSHPTIDVNLRCSRLQQTPLALAIEIGQEDIVQLLLSHPAIDINLMDKWGRDPLTLAIAGGRRDIVQLLLSYPTIDLNLLDRNGHTPAERAVRHASMDIASLVLETSRSQGVVVSKESLLQLSRENSDEGVFELVQKMQ